MEGIFAFHGADHKVGVTMISQSVAETIALKHRDKKVLLIALNGRKNADYIRENTESIDSYKLKIENRLVAPEEVMMAARIYDNFYMVGGPVREEEKRYYFPNAAEYFLEVMGERMDIIISDTGSEADNGLAIGGLSAAKKRFLVLTQQESAIKNYENKRYIFEKLGIEFEKHIVNKFRDNDPYSMALMGKRLNILKDDLIPVKEVDQGRIAEMERKTLLRYKDRGYGKAIENIVAIIEEVAGTGEDRKKKLWGNFI